eukprot:1159016-Pelagomonas_calceolata.AAC.6
MTTQKTGDRNRLTWLLGLINADQHISIVKYLVLPHAAAHPKTSVPKVVWICCYVCKCLHKKAVHNKGSKLHAI